jgi:ppGpp synthetase/RelA/SpoT-type nucleotidyltranferase
VIDRRINPSHGYRAVHIIAKVSGMPIEIQVRTSLHA